MTADERDALRALHRALVVLKAYGPSAILHRLDAADVREALGEQGEDSPLEVDYIDGTRLAPRLLFGPLHIFTKETP